MVCQDVFCSTDVGVEVEISEGLPGLQQSSSVVLGEVDPKIHAKEKRAKWGDTFTTNLAMHKPREQLSCQDGFAQETVNCSKKHGICTESVHETRIHLERPSLGCRPALDLVVAFFPIAVSIVSVYSAKVG